MRPLRCTFFVQKYLKCWRMFRLIGTIDKPISVKVVPSSSYLMDIAGNSYDGVSHSWHFQFRDSFPARERKRRRDTDLISIKMLWRHVWIVYRHSEKNSLRKNILRFGPLDQCIEGGKNSVHFEGIRNPNIGDLPFGNVDYFHWKRGSLFFRAHRETIFVFRKEFFANLALFDLAALSKLTWRRVVAGSEGAGKRSR